MRDTTKDAMRSNIDHVIQQLVWAMRDQLEEQLRNCPRCTHFNGNDEICRLAGKRPPAHIIANGCDKYEYDIPF